MLLITGEEQDFVAGNKAFLEFASANTKDVLRFAYVYQRHQQPLCQALLPNQAALSPQVSAEDTCISTQSHHKTPTVCSSIEMQSAFRKSYSVFVLKVLIFMALRW